MPRLQGKTALTTPPPQAKGKRFLRDPEFAVLQSIRICRGDILAEECAGDGIAVALQRQLFGGARLLPRTSSITAICARRKNGVIFIDRNTVGGVASPPGTTEPEVRGGHCWCRNRSAHLVRAEGQSKINSAIQQPSCSTSPPSTSAPEINHHGTVRARCRRIQHTNTSAPGQVAPCRVVRVACERAQPIAARLGNVRLPGYAARVELVQTGQRPPCCPLIKPLHDELVHHSEMAAAAAVLDHQSDFQTGRSTGWRFVSFSATATAITQRKPATSEIHGST